MKLTRLAYLIPCLISLFTQACLANDDKAAYEAMKKVSTGTFKRVEAFQASCGSSTSKSCKDSLTEMCGGTKASSAWLFNAPNDLYSAVEKHFQKKCASHARSGTESHAKMRESAQRARDAADQAGKERADVSSTANYYRSQGELFCASYWDSYILLRELYKETCNLSSP